MPNMFEQAGSVIGALFDPQSYKNLADATKKNPFPVVSPQTRQLGKALPTQPGSLGGLINNPNAPQQLAVKPTSGLIPAQGQSKLVQQPVPQKSVAEHIQDKLSTHDQAIADAQKQQKLAQAQFGANQANGKDISSNSMQSNTPTLTAGSTSSIVPKQYLDSNGNPTDTLPVNTSTPFSKSTDFPGVLNTLVNKSSAPSADYTDAKKNADMYNEALKQSRINEAQGLSANAGNPIPLEFQQGRGQIIQNQYTQEQAALGSAYNAATAQQGAANTQQGLQQTGLTSAAGLAQPVNQLGLLTNPQNGQPLNPQVATNAVQQAYQLIKNGADINDPNVQALIAPFGTWGLQSLTGMLNSGGNFNPTTQSTQVQSNQSNLADTQKQAYSVNQNLQQIDKIQPVLENFLKTSGINPYQAQIYNGPVNDYLTSIGNSGAAASWAAQMGDLKNYTSQLLASGYGGTPSGTEQQTLSQDPSKLSYAGLQTYLETLKGLGQNRLSVLQGNIKSLGGNSTGYSGPATSGVNSVSSGSMSPTSEIGGGQTNPLLQAGVGTGVETFNALTSIPGMIGTLLGHIF